MRMSVVISAFNEEKKIEACLKSIKWADEIVVVDNSSTDKTGDIARTYTKHVYIQKNDPSSIDIQKNFGIEKATCEWVLVLDADEEVTPELAEEIKEVVSQDKSVDGYWLPRKNIIFGKWIEHTGWYPDPQLRLFKKGKGKFEQEHVHEPLALDGKTEYLKEHLLHHNFESVSQFLYKSFQVYAPNEAEDLLRKGYIFNYRDVIRFPLKEFLSRYFAREGYKDGFHGLVLSFLMAFYHFAVFVYLWEKKSFAPLSKDDVKHELQEEAKQAQKEIAYWISKKKIEEEKNNLKKLGLKLKKKIGI